MILMNLIKMSKIIDCLYIHKLFTKIYENYIKFIKFNIIFKLYNKYAYN